MAFAITSSLPFRRLKQSNLTPAERVERIATIRRSLIPVLERINDSAGAVDQYIEVIDSYPEDEALTKEAAAYAVAHGQAPRMTRVLSQDHCRCAARLSLAIVLARIETAAEDYPSAIADYERAIKARPDRADVVQAKAGLEERLMRFDDAIASYGRLYELSYRDPQWMIKVAELRARPGQNRRRRGGAQDGDHRGATGNRRCRFFDRRICWRSWHIAPRCCCIRGARRKVSLGAELFEQPIVARGDLFAHHGPRPPDERGHLEAQR